MITIIKKEKQLDTIKKREKKIQNHIPMPQYCNIFKVIIIYLIKERSEIEKRWVQKYVW